MAFDAYMMFSDSTGKPLLGESQMQVAASDPLSKAPSAGGLTLTPGQIFEIDDFSFDIEQVLNIGSHSSGIGSGKPTFNPFSITRKTDRASPTIFLMCCAGQHFQQVSLFLRRAGGAAGNTASNTNTSATSQSGTTFLRFDFRLVGIKTIEWSGADGDESPKEAITFEYGAVQIQYQQQDEKGAAKGGASSGSWNRVYNNNDFTSIAAK